MFNTLKMLPFLVEAGRLDNWIEFVVAILDSTPEPSLSTQTVDMEAIDRLDNHDQWKLKGICSKISVKIYQK